MSDIETSAETFESILKGILEKGDGDAIDKLGSKIENETLLNKLNLTKEYDAFDDEEYTFEKDKDITGLDDSEKIKIANILTDLLGPGYFEGCEEEINELLEICPKNIDIDIDIDMIKTEIDSKIEKMIESNKGIVNEAYKELKLGDGNIMMAAIRNNNISCYQQYKEIE